MGCLGKAALVVLAPPMTVGVFIGLGNALPVVMVVAFAVIVILAVSGVFNRRG